MGGDGFVIGWVEAACHMRCGLEVGVHDPDELRRDAAENRGRMLEAHREDAIASETPTDRASEADEGAHRGRQDEVKKPHLPIARR